MPGGPEKGKPKADGRDWGTDASSRSVISLRAAIIAATLLVLAFVTWDAFQFGGEFPTLAFTDVMSFVAPGLAAAACFWTARTVPTEGRLAWRLLGGAAASWGLGQVVWTYYEVALDHPVPFPSLADLGYLALIPLGAGAIAAFPSSPRLTVSRARTFLDGLFIAASLLFLSWGLVLGPVYKTATGTLPQKLIGLAYPLGDVVLLTVVILTVGRTRPGVRHPLVLVGAGLAAIAISDSLFAVLTATTQYTTGTYVDDGWFVGFLLIGLAAVSRRQSSKIEALPERVSAPSTIVLPMVPVSLAIFLALYKETTLGSLEPFLFYTAILIVGVVLTRQVLELLSERQLAARLEAAYAKLQIVENQRVQLLNNVAHDLGTPLTPINIQLHLLETSGEAFSDQTRRSHVIIRRNTESMKLLLADLMDVARMEAGQLKIHTQPIDLAAAMRAGCDSLRDAMQERGVELEVRADEPLPVSADAGRVNQVLYNLLTNAMKFTPKGGRVAVDAVRDGSTARVEVTDSGRGLTDDEMAKLFRPFSQVHRPGEVKERGTGLGLYITRGIVTRHGGVTGVSSRGLGQGSTFWFMIPLDPASMPAREDPIPAA